MTQEFAVDQPVYRLSDDKVLSLADLLHYFSEVGGMRITDMHIKVGSPPVYRIDGNLQKMKGPPLDEETVTKLVRAMLTDIEWEEMGNERSVDTSCVSGSALFRVNCFHDSAGLAAAVRALEETPPPVEQIGFPNDVWQDIINLRQGLVLFTGVTGAGKSTTIASLLHRIAYQHPCRIMTLEDPVEYRIPSSKALISQREVGRDVLSFERGLRDCLREDPDVIFVGEMRDRESARWTLTAAETGHLVFSTLHTRDARGSITRLIDMFPPMQQDEIAAQLSLGLAYVISQKLIPRADGPGRVVAMEILNNSYALANIIRHRKLEQMYSMMQTRTRDLPEERMRTLERSLAQLVVDGTISPVEAERWANDPAAFLSELKALKAKPLERK